MQLKTKFILLIALVTCCSYGVTFYRTSSFQEELVVQQATRQAKMLFNQIRITRQWVADHNGLFLVKAPGVEENPFLPNAQIQDDAGNWLVKRNPAMVTRELSRYAAKEGMGQFNVTSLNPKNPDNIPDNFERTSLESFSLGPAEAVAMETVDGKNRLRYMAPLEVDERCLGCHTERGYEVGDIHGGMSVSIPMDWAYTEIRKNNKLLLNIAVATIVIVSLVIYVLFNLLVGRRMKHLARQMAAYPDEKLPDAPEFSDSKDEIGALSGNFHELCLRLEQSQEELDSTREQVFQSEKQAALGRLVAGVSHEINNPLGGMQNCIQVMQSSADQPEKMSRYLELLEQGVERIKGTVQQLLDIGRQEPMELQHGNVDKMIRDCIELTCVGRKNIDLELQLNVGYPLLVGMEALRQVIINLAGNAVQSMGDKGGVLSVKSSHKDNRLTIIITDSGTGIPEEFLDKIFEPFFTTKDVGEGTGLGLSVSYSLIEQMNGELTAHNAEDGGAVFTVSLPILGNHEEVSDDN
jgi:signal transduction histidine kinase